MNLIEMVNTVCLIKSLFNDQIYTKSTMYIIYHIVSVFFTVHIMQINRNNIRETSHTGCLIKSLINSRNVPTINTVTYLTHNFCFMHWSNHESTKLNLREIANTVCLLN